MCTCKSSRPSPSPPLPLQPSFLSQEHIEHQGRVRVTNELLDMRLYD